MPTINPSILFPSKNGVDNIEGYMITPTMINPDDKDSVVFGIMDMSDKTMKYKVTISPNN